MKRLKPFKTLEEQADILLSRGCVGIKADIVEKLKFVNYYRLSGYLYPFRKTDEASQKKVDSFVPGTVFNAVWNIYRFDRRLRIIILDAIERIEIALRTRIAYLWSESTKNEQGEYCSNPQANAYLSKKEGFYSDFLKSVQKSYDNSTADCAIHHKANGIKCVKDLPIWVFVEFMTFGNFRPLIDKGLPPNVKTKLAESFGFSKPKKLSSALSIIREIRNACAHHGRVWNRSWSYKSKKSTVPMPIAPELPDFEHIAFSSTERTKTGYFLLLCDFMLQSIAPQSQWKKRLRNLFNEIEINPIPMGFKTRIDFEKWLSAS